MHCVRCGSEVDPDEIYQVQGQQLCEDCAMAAQKGPKACDVWAVRIATHTRSSLGHQGTEGLTELQSKIYDYIRSTGGATAREITEALEITAAQFEREFAILRHCELGRATKRGNEVYFIPWD
ncbi:MAG: hypothetical protein D9V47_14495 [Clostridia bacterium]|nr:MAG: hypothetical protein D9V47_14495 [Clostridia bacterium]